MLVTKKQIIEMDVRRKDRRRDIFVTGKKWVEVENAHRQFRLKHEYLLKNYLQ